MWKTGTIGDVLSVIQNGVNCNQDKSGKGLKITRIETIADANINFNKTGFSNLDENQKQKAALNKGDILFSHINSPIHVGKTAIYDGSEPLYHGINLLRLNTIYGVDSNYFNFFLQSLFWSGYWRRTAKQSVNQASVNQTDIKKIPFAYPPLAEQERIVAKLDTAFAEIDGAIEKAQAKEKEIQKLKASLLNISLSSDAVASETLKLGDLCDVITKGTTPTSVGFKFESDGINFIKVESLTSNNGFIPGKFAKISTDCNESLKRSQLQKGDILFSIAGALGRTAIVTEDILPANTNQALAIIRLKSNIEIDTRFLLYLLNSDTTREQSERNKGGVAQQNLSLTQLKNYDVYLPSFTEQQHIVARLDAAFNELENANGAIKKSKLNYSSLKAAILTKELQSSEAA
ncbi:restriction endonuclease subunit S [Gammaproteobacteria bacterium]|nr:restriction endonuclease subunit S [Gammaproteobacteria bacterium]